MKTCLIAHARFEIDLDAAWDVFGVGTVDLGEVHADLGTTMDTW